MYINMHISDSSFCICKAFLALAKVSRDKLPVFPAVEDVPSVLDFPGTSRDLVIVTPLFSCMVEIEDRSERREWLGAKEFSGKLPDALVSDSTAVPY